MHLRKHELTKKSNDRFIKSPKTKSKVKIAIKHDIKNIPSSKTHKTFP
jgi:hypothetical protein